MEQCLISPRVIASFLSFSQQLFSCILYARVDWDNGPEGRALTHCDITPHPSLSMTDSGCFTKHLQMTGRKYLVVTSLFVRSLLLSAFLYFVSVSNACWRSWTSKPNMQLLTVSYSFLLEMEPLGDAAAGQGRDPTLTLLIRASSAVSPKWALFRLLLLLPILQQWS